MGFGHLVPVCLHVSIDQEERVILIKEPPAFLIAGGFFFENSCQISHWNSCNPLEQSLLRASQQ